MAEQSSFFNSVAGDRKYNASRFAEYFASVLTNGIFNGGTNLQVFATGSDNKSRIKVGKAWINGYYYHNTQEMALPHPPADVTNDRVDRIVLRLDLRQESRHIRAFIKQGTPSATPAPPLLQRDSEVWEISLAKVLVPANTVGIPAENVTSERLDTAVCGLVNSLIQADTTQIFNEFDTFRQVKQQDVQAAVDQFIAYLQEAEEVDISEWLAAFQTGAEADWQAWFSEQQTAGFMMLGTTGAFVNRHSALLQRIDERGTELEYDSGGNLVRVLEKAGNDLLRETLLSYSPQGQLVQVKENLLDGEASATEVTETLIYDIDGNLERVDRGVL